MIPALKKILKVIYNGWMKFAKVLGRIQTTIILSLIYFTALGAIAVISFIFRKDFLDKKLTDKDTYWQPRTAEPPTLENAKRLF